MECLNAEVRSFLGLEGSYPRRQSEARPEEAAELETHPGRGRVLPAAGGFGHHAPGVRPAHGWGRFASPKQPCVSLYFDSMYVH